eukprot:scaffold3796_cov1604-Pavlova_lutheri.AAC.1
MWGGLVLHPTPYTLHPFEKRRRLRAWRLDSMAPIQHGVVQRHAASWSCRSSVAHGWRSSVTQPNDVAASRPGRSRHPGRHAGRRHAVEAPC